MPREICFSTEQVVYDVRIVLAWAILCGEAMKIEANGAKMVIIIKITASHTEAIKWTPNIDMWNGKQSQMLFPESYGRRRPLQLHKWCSTTHCKKHDLLTLQDWKFLHHYDICLKTDHCPDQPKSSMKHHPLQCMALVEYRTWNVCAITCFFWPLQGRL